MRQAVLAVARDLAKRHPHPAGDLFDHDGPVPAAPPLMQAALELTRHAGDRAEALSDLSGLLATLISTWPALAEGVGGFAQRAWEELPPGEARYFGDIAVRARALR